MVQTDRGGQVTYHGPGQITAYLLFDLRRMGLGVRDLVTGIEVAMVNAAAHYGIQAQPRPDAPGVYVQGDKLGSLGLRVRHGCAYHGLSFNVNVDLEPFSRINPCGLLGVRATRVADLAEVEFNAARQVLLGALLTQFNLRGRTSDNLCAGPV